MILRDDFHSNVCGPRHKLLQSAIDGAIKDGDFPVRKLLVYRRVRENQV